MVFDEFHDPHPPEPGMHEFALVAERAQGIRRRRAAWATRVASVVLLVGAQPRGDLLSALAVLLTALCYAASALYAGARLSTAPSMLTSFGTLAIATVTTLPLGMAQLPGEAPSWKVIGSGPPNVPTDCGASPTPPPIVSNWRHVDEIWRRHSRHCPSASARPSC